MRFRTRHEIDYTVEAPPSEVLEHYRTLEAAEPVLGVVVEELLEESPGLKRANVRSGGLGWELQIEDGRPGSVRIGFTGRGSLTGYRITEQVIVSEVDGGTHVHVDAEYVRPPWNPLSWVPQLTNLLYVVSARRRRAIITRDARLEMTRRRRAWVITAALLAPTLVMWAVLLVPALLLGPTAEIAYMGLVLPLGIAVIMRPASRAGWAALRSWAGLLVLAVVVWVLAAYGWADRWTIDIYAAAWGVTLLMLSVAAYVVYWALLLRRWAWVGIGALLVLLVLPVGAAVAPRSMPIFGEVPVPADFRMGAPRSLDSLPVVEGEMFVPVRSALSTS